MTQKKKSKASRAIELVEASGAKLWHNPDGEPYVDVFGEQGERRTHRIRSRATRTWLSGLMYAAEGSALGGQAATDAVDVLSAMAVHGGPEREVYVRIAGHDGNVYLDLGDATWRAVEITARGWSIVDHPPVRFRRPRGLRGLPVPSSAPGGWDALRALLHLSDGRDWILLLAWLVGALHPSGPYPILTLTGEHGSAKTSVGRIARSIVDPSEAPLRSPPREDRELVIAARNSHIIGLDNLSRVWEWLSDALCRIATGGGYSARELYSDGDEVVFSDRRPIILTSIEDVATRGDLADRAIAVTLPRIPEQARRPEREINAEMDRIRPRVLGALLDAASTGLRRISSVDLDRLPRMADFAEWVVACEPSLPWDEGAFLAAYAEARDEMVETGIEADPVATALHAYLKEKDIGAWRGKAGDLLTELDGRRKNGTKPPRGWPETPQAMGGRISRIAPLLRAAGWAVERGDGRERHTVYITPKRHGDENDAHDAHDAHASSNDAGSGREHGREHGAHTEDDAHGDAHADKPTPTRDVRTRAHGEHDLQSRTNASDEALREVLGDA